MNLARVRGAADGFRIVRTLQHRLSTSAGRFRIAVSLGFVIAAVGCLVIGHGTRFSDAQSFWGGMDLTPFLGGAPQQVTRPRGAPSPQYVQRHRVRTARHEAKPRERGDRERGDKGGLAFVRADGAGSGPQRSMCVRLCDGFVFPIGNYHGDGDRAAHEATCQAECPGAKTALFVEPQGSDSIAEAADARTGRNYSKLPDAFHYTTYLDGSCSCHPASGNRIKSLLHDFTLRRGDAVMTRAGIRVFHGGSGRFPFKRNDFVALSRSRDVRKTDRASLKAIERASLATPSTMAENAAPKPIVGAQRGGTRALQHQARN